MATSDVDAYLARLSPEKKATLETMRERIRAAAPGAAEGMSYGMPAFILGRPVAGYAASGSHCAYYPMSGHVIGALADELAGYETSKGAIRFPIGKPLPAALIRKLVKARLAEIDAAKAKKGASKPRASKPRASKGVASKGVASKGVASKGVASKEKAATRASVSSPRGRRAPSRRSA